MTQAFVSTSRNHYRWNCQFQGCMSDVPRANFKISRRHVTKLTKFQPPGDKRLLDINKEIDGKNDLSEIEVAPHKVYLRHLRSTYKISYFDRR
ncbi:uncharacterized protein [Euwallacea similis]|uniref:uncharacterized protein n=1 Tax=Euwallacea similis TaxID=1736056 RepID=UPI00344F30C5